MEWFLYIFGGAALVFGTTAALIWKRWWRTERPKEEFHRGPLGAFGLGFTVATIVAVLAGGIGLGTAYGDQIICRNTAANRGVDYRWSMSAGCYFRYADRWVGSDDPRYHQRSGEVKLRRSADRSRDPPPARTSRGLRNRSTDRLR